MPPKPKPTRATKPKDLPKPKPRSKPRRKREAAAPAASPPPPASSGLPRVRIRMYRQGLGDCFLLTFNPGADQVCILIDFGTLGSAEPLATMEEVMANLEKETAIGSNTPHLNLLIATHEHQDHLSGFRTFKERFKKFQVDRVWLAWTEDKNDPLTKLLGDPRDIALALAGAAKVLLTRQGVDEQAHTRGETMSGLLAFLGEFGADGFAPTVDEAMKFVRDAFGAPRFLKPGNAPLEEPWLPGFRFYILGPPHSEAALKDMGENGDPRLYGLDGLAAASAMQLGAVADPGACEREMPFDARFRRREDDPVVAPVLSSYLSDEAKWRRVDTDWLYNAPELALQFDNYINNTSFAFALERIADGKVLLFPADAQAGNWHSWQGLKWSVPKPDRSSEELTVRDLLGRTVFYKAGHHASHNGTAKAEGLEQMTRTAELVVFIPVDRAKALNHHPEWKMPARELYAHLIEASGGRVARSDIGWVVNPSTQAGAEAALGPVGTPALWQTWRANQESAPVQVQSKWIDFVLE